MTRVVQAHEKALLLPLKEAFGGELKAFIRAGGGQSRGRRRKCAWLASNVGSSVQPSRPFPGRGRGGTRQRVHVSEREKAQRKDFPRQHHAATLRSSSKTLFLNELENPAEVPTPEALSYRRVINTTFLSPPSPSRQFRSGARAPLLAPLPAAGPPARQDSRGEPRRQGRQAGTHRGSGVPDAAAQHQHQHQQR